MVIMHVIFFPYHVGEDEIIFKNKTFFGLFGPTHWDSEAGIVINFTIYISLILEML